MGYAKVLVLYLFIGGALTGLVDRNYVNECGEHLPDKTITRIVVLWPAAMGLSIASKSTGESICKETKGELP